MKRKETAIATDRLVLRPLTQEDWNIFIDQVFESGECLLQFGYEQTEDFRECVAEPSKDEVIYYTIVLAETDEMIGYVGLAPKSNNIEFYVFAGQRRKGYAYEAVRAFMDSCIDGVVTGKPHTKFTAETIHDNEPCIGLLKKLGFKECRVGFRIDSGLGLIGFDYSASVNSHRTLQ